MQLTPRVPIDIETSIGLGIVHIVLGKWFSHFCELTHN